MKAIQLLAKHYKAHTVNRLLSYLKSSFPYNPFGSKTNKRLEMTYKEWLLAVDAFVQLKKLCMMHCQRIIASYSC